MQKESKENLLKILKSCGDLQEFVSRVSRDDLNDFESDLKSLKGALESFEDASEGEVEPQDSNGDLNGDQLEIE